MLTSVDGTPILEGSSKQPVVCAMVSAEAGTAVVRYTPQGQLFSVPMFALQAIEKGTSAGRGLSSEIRTGPMWQDAAELRRRVQQAQALPVMDAVMWLGQLLEDEDVRQHQDRKLMVQAALDEAVQQMAMGLAATSVAAQHPVSSGVGGHEVVDSGTQGQRVSTGTGVQQQAVQKGSVSGCGSADRLPVKLSSQHRLNVDRSGGVSAGGHGAWVDGAWVPRVTPTHTITGVAGLHGEPCHVVDMEGDSVTVQVTMTGALCVVQHSDLQVRSGIAVQERAELAQQLAADTRRHQQSSAGRGDGAVPDGAATRPEV